jgi:hypothetical protein
VKTTIDGVVMNMSWVTIELPDILAQLPPAERDNLIQAGVKEAMRARLNEIRQEFAEAQERVEHFTARYGMGFYDFEAHYLKTNNSFQVHEDYNDWFFWQQVLERNQAILDQLTEHVE